MYYDLDVKWYNDVLKIYLCIAFYMVWSSRELDVGWGRTGKADGQWSKSSRMMWKNEKAGGWQTEEKPADSVA